MFRSIGWQRSPHFTAVFQALFVTFLWSTSWVLIKIGLEDIPPLTFAGLRYGLAFLCLLPFFWRGGGLAEVRQLERSGWLRLLALGIIYYAVTQGTQFVGLTYLPAVTVNVLLGFTSVMVALLGLGVLGERPSPWQWLGIFVALGGGLLYFYPVQIPQAQWVGFVAVVVGVLANAGSAVLGRAVNRAGHLRPLTVTTVSMGIGSAILLVVGVGTQGLPALSWQSWAIIGWLAVVNTAVAFTLWNHSLRTLSAMESSIINNTMAVQIPILAVLFLGERLNGRQVTGLVVAIIGALLVQLGRKPR
ncbi:MAG: EamA family transporter [Ardenticatenaceae bacterium]|nr:EamA family transporter [Anaerolineales bacterium]MCB8940773.1 EamA family transporter [Ardenticatenaceae bacterium]MCB8972112.1 EamA family transporter [Ardenticatenaceae bacterium]